MLITFLKPEGNYLKKVINVPWNKMILASKNFNQKKVNLFQDMTEQTVKKNELDIEFDFRLDSKCGDPDTDSQKLYEIHRFLWSKELPNGKTFSLEIKGNSYGRLLIKNNLIMNMSSDRMCPHFDGKYSNKFDGWLTEIERAKLKHKVRTIGGHIIFPAHKKKWIYDKSSSWSK